MSESIQTVHVDLARRGHDIQIGSDLLGRAGAVLGQLGDVSRVAVLTDENVEQPHAHAVCQSFSEAEIETDLLVIEPGETSKSIDLATVLWERLLQLGADRRTVLVAVGGGVVGDLAGFVAATYARGIRFMQIPTSLLAQVDSSVGGKVGINLPNAKNMVGAFLQPIAVLIDTTALDTLDDRQYRAGLGEVVKYGMILDASLFDYLQRHVEPLLARRADALAEVIARCCRLKADVVEQDEHETSGRRAILNYGHTFGHAFEALAGYGEILHGEAVAMGMVCAARLAERMGRIDASVTARQRSLLEALELPVEVPGEMDVDAILRTMQHDKKVAHGQLRFILPSCLGEVELVGEVDEQQVREALE